MRKRRVWNTNLVDWVRDPIFIDEKIFYDNEECFESQSQAVTIEDFLIEITNISIVEDCTGLQDKNGVDAFDGDWVQDPDDLSLRWMIYWSKKYCGWMGDCSQDVVGGDDFAQLVNRGLISGNIHEVKA